MNQFKITVQHLYLWIKLAALWEVKKLFGDRQVGVVIQPGYFLHFSYRVCYL